MYKELCIIGKIRYSPIKFPTVLPARHTKILFSISRPELQFITATYTDRVMMARRLIGGETTNFVGKENASPVAQWMVQRMFPFGEPRRRYYDRT